MVNEEYIKMMRTSAYAVANVLGCNSPNQLLGVDLIVRFAAIGREFGDKVACAPPENYRAIQSHLDAIEKLLGGRK